MWRVIGCLSKSKETDPIFLPNEDLRELETRKRIQFWDSSNWSFQEPLVRAIKPQ